MKITWKDIAKTLKERADLDLTQKEANTFVREALVSTLRIMRKSKGKIQVKGCDVQQFYKPIPWEELEGNFKDLDETKDVQNKVWIY